MLFGLVLLLSAVADPAVTVETPTARSRVGITVSVDDYPRTARANREAGRAVARFLVNDRGRVHECVIVQSSGSSSLDTQTCNIVKRGRYPVARNADGGPVSTYWRWGIDWQQPEMPRIMLDNPAPETEYEAANAPPRPLTDPAPAVAVGKANWGAMPGFTIGRSARNAAPNANATVRKIIARKTCSFAGARANHYDVDVRYAIRIDPEGRIERIVVEDLGCRPLEQVVASMVLDEDFRRAIKVPADTEARWYSSMIRFTGR